MYSVARQGSTCGSESRAFAADMDSLMTAMQEDPNADISSYIYTPWYATNFYLENREIGYWYEDDYPGQIKNAYANGAKYNAIHNGGITKATEDAKGFPVYVFDNDALMYNVVQQYGEYLEANSLNVVEARLMTYEEAIDQGCDAGNSTCSSAPVWMYYTSYWLGSAAGDSSIYTIMFDGTFSTLKHNNDYMLGVRPVIVVSK